MLWLLETEELDFGEHSGFVIRALTEQEAREIANRAELFRQSEPFLDPLLSTCKLLNEDGPKGIILASFNAG